MPPHLSLLCMEPGSLLSPCAMSGPVHGILSTITESLLYWEICLVLIFVRKLDIMMVS